MCEGAQVSACCQQDTNPGAVSTKRENDGRAPGFVRRWSTSDPEEITTGLGQAIEQGRRQARALVSHFVDPAAAISRFTSTNQLSTMMGSTCRG
jgi:hypothetical protein